MNRREFLKASILSALSLTTAHLWTPISGLAEAIRRPDLVIVTGSDPGRVMRVAIDSMGGMNSFVAKGDIVVVKPNIGWDRTPEYAATTNPEVVAALVRLCLEAGAKTVKVFDHPVVDPQRCYQQSGIADAVRAVGGKVSFMDDRKFKDVKLPGYALKSWPLYEEILEADKVINVPIAKTHGLTTLTLGMKNWMGIMGGWRGRIHQKIDAALVDVALTIRPTLIVLDAIRVLTANGPQGGSLSDVKRMNTLVVGRDQIAVDACGATLFGLKGERLGYVRQGHEVGLGTMDWRRLDVIRRAV